MKIIAFTGRRGSGKNAAADALIENHGFVDLKFAGPLKMMLSAFYIDCGVSPIDIHRRLEGDLKEVPCEFLLGNTPRHAMQTLGTEWRDTLDSKLWTELFKKRCISGDYGTHIVCSDLRFPHEIEALKEIGAVTVRIDRPSAETNDAYAQHASETQIADLDVDLVIVNDGTLEELHAKVLAIFDGWQERRE